MLTYNVGNRIMNTWLYPIEGGWVMIDTGYENSYAIVVKKLRKFLIQPEDIRYIFLTHAHIHVHREDSAEHTHAHELTEHRHEHGDQCACGRLC